MVLALAAGLAVSTCNSIPEPPTGVSGTVDSTDRLAYVGLSEAVRFRLFIIDEDGSNPVPIVDDGADFQDPRFSPSGREIAVGSNRDGFWDIFVVDLDDLSLRNLTNSTHTDLAPTWSPDGKQIAFQRLLDNALDWEIFVMNADGTNVRNLTRSGGPDRRPAWSPDGTRIAYSSGERLSQEIWVIDADGGNARSLTPRRPGISGSPAWSPDGSQVAFESSAHQGDVSPAFFVEYDIYVINADGTDLRRIDEFSGPARSARYPAWSPDGNRLAFEIREVGGTFGASRFRIWVLDTSEDTLVEIPTGGTARAPAWSPLTNG